MLTAIVEAKRREVLALKQNFDYTNLPPVKRPSDSFLSALTSKGARVSLIAEVKKASPVKGVLADDFDPLSLAGTYFNEGASAVSVITDSGFFMGSKSFIPQIKQACPLPVLRKDFIMDEVQVYESLALGADAVLLIAAILDHARLLRLIELSRSLGLEPLVEIHDRRDLQMALDTPAQLIGINNRNLKTFKVDINTSLMLADTIPDHITKISESGIRTPQDMLLLEQHGYKAALVGEALVTSPDTAGQVRRLADYGSHL